MGRNLDIPTSSENSESYKVSQDIIYLYTHTHTYRHIYIRIHIHYMNIPIYTTIDSCNCNVLVIFKGGIKWKTMIKIGPSLFQSIYQPHDHLAHSHTPVKEQVIPLFTLAVPDGIL